MLRLTFASIIMLVLSALAAPVQAQDIDTFVMVPDGPPGGALVAGCYRSDRQLFGYRFTMCLRNRGGTYTVSGRGFNCEGRLSWRAAGRDIFIDIRRQSCGRGRAWEAASIECRASGVVRGVLDSIFGRGANPFVMVPDTPAVRTLRCTYFPTVRGVAPVTFTARRI